MSDEAFLELLQRHPAPWRFGYGYEQTEPGGYIADGRGHIVYADGSHERGDACEPFELDALETLVWLVNRAAAGLSHDLRDKS
jgi:hypothetical protein